MRIAFEDRHPVRRCITTISIILCCVYEDSAGGLCRQPAGPVVAQATPSCVNTVPIYSAKCWTVGEAGEASAAAVKLPRGTPDTNVMLHPVPEICVVRARIKATVLIRISTSLMLLWPKLVQGIGHHPGP